MLSLIAKIVIQKKKKIGPSADVRRTLQEFLFLFKLILPCYGAGEYVVSRKLLARFS